MFYTSVITSILPYILFLGIMCTYYFGITNEALSSGHNTNIDSFTSISVFDEVKTPSEKNYHINTTFVDFLSETNQFCSAQNSKAKIIFPEYINKRKEQDVSLHLFSRPPPSLS